MIAPRHSASCSRPSTSFGALLRFQTGSSGAGIAGWSFLVIGLLVLLIATGDAGRWAVRWWAIALLAWFLAALPAWLGSAAPDLEGVLTPAALAMAVLAGLGTASFLGEIRRLGLGWRQAGAVLAAAAVVVSVFGFLGDIGGGRFHQPADDWPQALSWMDLQGARGPFRVLWVGDATDVPGYRASAGADGYVLSNGGTGDLRDALPPPGGAGAAAASDAMHALRTGATQRFGRSVAPMAVRYVVLTERVAPDADPTAPSPLAPALAEQLDLRELQSQAGARVYENTAWVPGDAVVAGRVPVGPSQAPLGATTGRADDPGAVRGTVLWSQQHDDAWEADERGRDADAPPGVRLGERVRRGVRPGRSPCRSPTSGGAGRCSRWKSSSSRSSDAASCVAVGDVVVAGTPTR